MHLYLRNPVLGEEVSKGLDLHFGKGGATMEDIVAKPKIS